MRLSRQAVERFCTNGEVLPGETDLRGGLQGLKRAARGDSSSSAGSVTWFGVIFQFASPGGTEVGGRGRVVVAHFREVGGVESRT